VRLALVISLSLPARPYVVVSSAAQFCHDGGLDMVLIWVVSRRR
jgi:hypothetical protein